MSMYNDNRSLSQVYADFLNPPEQQSQGPVGRYNQRSSSMFKTDISKTVKSLTDRGFSESEIKSFLADVDTNPDEYGITSKVRGRGDELNRYLMAYVDESSKLYQQTLDTEKEMKREEADARLQRDYDKAVLEASKQTTEETGLVAEKKRDQQKSKEYLQSKGGTSMREARKGGAVMIPQRRPM